MSGKRIVMGITEPFDRSDETRIITMAAVTVAVMATVGNREPELGFQVLREVSINAYQALSEDTRQKLHAMADEMIACTKAGNRFMGFASFAKEDSNG